MSQDLTVLLKTLLAQQAQQSQPPALFSGFEGKLESIFGKERPRSNKLTDAQVVSAVRDRVIETDHPDGTRTRVVERYTWFGREA